jgi:hypothetical protein
MLRAEEHVKEIKKEERFSEEDRCTNKFVLVPGTQHPACLSKDQLSSGNLNELVILAVITAATMKVTVF